jgi:radical SAM protein with 4Fe4S-binding SPASM domain
MLIKRYKKWLRHVFHNRNRIMGLRITTTWRCNCRCKTCHIWEIDYAGQKDLTVDEIDRVTQSKYFRYVEYITLSGGEPTLRQDLPEYIAALHKNIPNAVINMTTNGMNPDAVEKMFAKVLKDNPKIKFGLVGLSLNGPQEVHDATRGVGAAFDKVIETYERIKDMVPCQFSFTFCRENVDYFEWVQDFARKKGTSAYICWTVMNERFKVSDRDLVFWKTGMEKVLAKYAKERFKYPDTLKGKLENLFFLPPGIVSHYFYDHVVNKRIMPCYAGSQIVHIDPWGDIYPCNFKLSADRILGNIREKSFDEIWKSFSKKTLKKIRKGECMYPNGLCGDSDIYPSVNSHPPALMKWYLKKWIKKKELVEKLPGKSGDMET